MRISDWSSDVCSSDLARDEARIGHEDAGALRRDGRGERGEDCDRGGLHHEAGYLEHDRGDLLDEGEHSGSIVVDGGHSRADEDREDDDLEDLVLGHSLNARMRDEVGDELLERVVERSSTRLNCSQYCATRM